MTNRLLPVATQLTRGLGLVGHVTEAFHHRYLNRFFRFGSEHGEGKFKRLIICIASRLLAHVVTSAGFSWNSQLVTLEAVKQKL